MATSKVTLLDIVIIDGEDWGVVEINNEDLSIIVEQMYSDSKNPARQTILMSDLIEPKYKILSAKGEEIQIKEPYRVPSEGEKA